MIQEESDLDSGTSNRSLNIKYRQPEPVGCLALRELKILMDPSFSWKLSWHAM